MAAGGRAALRAVCALPAAASAVLDSHQAQQQLLLQAVLGGDTQRVQLLCQLPWAAVVTAEGMQQLLQAALALHDLDCRVLELLCQLPGAQQLDAAQADSLLMRAFEVAGACDAHGVVAEVAEQLGVQHPSYESLTEVMRAVVDSTTHDLSPLLQERYRLLQQLRLTLPALQQLPRAVHTLLCAAADRLQTLQHLHQPVVASVDFVHAA